MNGMRVIAKAGDIEVVQDMNGLYSIQRGRGMYFCDGKSAYELIRDEVQDPTVRAELLKQWNADLGVQARAERNSKNGEFRG